MKWDADTDWYALVLGSDFGGGGATKFAISNGYGSERLVIDNTGKVGIGTSTPSSQLHVAGDITTGNGGILWKTYSGTTGAAGTTTTVAHGLTASKILSFTCNVYYANTTYYQFGAVSFAANTRHVAWDGTNATITYDADANWNSKAYRCIAQYIP